MKNEQLYHKTVDILVQAYFNDTLQAVNACGCAVGNLVAHNMNYSVIKTEGKEVRWKDQPYPVDPGWTDVHCLVKIDMDKYTGLAKEQLDSTGYTPFETLIIERAFEDGYMEADSDAMFKALCSVIDALDEIHENVDPVITTSSKQKFVKV